MTNNLLLLLRISQCEYNESLWKEYTLYMNSQNYFKRQGLEGQCDISEGLVVNGPAYLRYSSDEGKNWRELGEVQSISRDCNAYIYCMYGVIFNRDKYDPIRNEYVHDIPWECISGLYVDNITELMLLKNTSVFLNKFEQSVNEAGLSYSYGPVKYDLEEKLKDTDYFRDVINAPVQVLFHKKKEYEMQNEVRFAVICPDKPDHYELHMKNDNTLIFERVKLKRDLSIRIVIKNLKFNDKGEPINFSSDVELYEGIMA